MIDTIFLGMSGMQGHQRGLSVISNNVANMNTPGFRGSTVVFADVFVGGGGNGQLAGQQGAGGLNAQRALVDTHAGGEQRTDRALDLRLDGSGFFVVQDENGSIRYTRNGSFEFVDGMLVTRGEQLKVMTRNGSGQLVPLETKNLRQNPPRATSKVTFRQILSRTDPEHVVDPVVVHDAAGGKHTLKVEFRRETVSGNLTTWTVTVFEGLAVIGSGQMSAIGNEPGPDSSLLKMALTLQDGVSSEITFDFTSVQFIDAGADSSLQVAEQDGFGVGEITSQTLDENGVVQLAYSNGQKASGPKLTLAAIANEAELVQLGNSLFEFRGSEPVVFRDPGDDLKVVSGSLEGSNVDLTQEFSELILMQRGYQASSQVVTTANEMLQELFDLRKRG